MQITLENGEILTVTDLDAAIEQAESFKGMRHKNNECKELDDKLNAHWSEVHEKLLELKNAKPDTFPDASGFEAG